MQESTSTQTDPSKIRMAMYLTVRWSEHFEERLNPPPPQNLPDITPAEEVLQINCERPSKAEIEKAIPHMKRGKASGPAKFLPRQSRLT